MSDEPPISLAELRRLFEHLDRISSTGYECDHTYALTKDFLQKRGLSVEPMLRWLGHNGAGCDCEVMFNVAQQWGEIVGYVAPDADAAESRQGKPSVRKPAGMVGMTPVCGLIGMLLGLVFGCAWGVHRGWLATIGASIVGAVAGLLSGRVWALLMQWSTSALNRVTKRIAPSHRVLADVVLWSGFFLILIVFIGPLVYLSRVAPKFHE